MVADTVEMTGRAYGPALPLSPVSDWWVNEDGLLRMEAKYLGVLDARIEALRPACKRYGFAVPRYEVVDTTVQEPVFNTESGLYSPRRTWATVRFIETPLVLDGGWEFVGVVHHTHAGNAVFTAPAHREAGTVSHEALVNAEPTCDHCGVTRARSKTIVVVNSAGDVKRIGGACAKVYLRGLANPSDAFLSFLMSLEDLGADVTESERAAGDKATADEVMATAAAVIRVLGYQRDGVTKGIVQDLLHSNFRRPVSDRPARDFVPTLDDWAMSDAARLYALELQGGEFESNLRVAVASGNVSRFAGLMVYAVEHYRRSIAEVSSCDKPVRDIPTTPVPYGTQVVTGAVVWAGYRTTDFGTFYKVALRDDRGFEVYGTCPSKAMDLANEYLGRDIEAGDRMTFTAELSPSEKNNGCNGFFRRPKQASVEGIPNKMPKRAKVDPYEDGDL